MHRDQFERELQRFMRSKAWTLSEREEPASALEIRTFEEELGFALPREYVDLACRFGAGAFGFIELFSVRAGEWNIEVQRMSAPGLPASFLPISDNGCGDFYGFVVEDGACNGAIFFADHELSYEVRATEFSDLYEYITRYGFNAA